MLRLILDGNIIAITDHSNIQDAGVTITRSTERIKDGRPSRSFSGKITFYNESYAYNHIKFVLLANYPNFSNKIYIKVYDDCCDLSEDNHSILFSGVATRANMSFGVIENGKCICNDISIAFEEDSDFSSRFDCLKSKLIAADTTDPVGSKPTFQNPARGHRMMRWCYQVQPRIIQHVFLATFVTLTTLFLNPILTFLYVLFFIVDAFIFLYNQVASLVGFDEIDLDNDTEGNQGLVDVLTKWVVNIGEWIKGCGKGIATIFIRDYIQNVCDQCGIIYDAGPDSIFNNVNSNYYNAVYIPQTNVEGSRNYSHTYAKFWELNSPIKSGYEFLNDIQEPFNAYWDLLETPAGAMLVFQKKKLQTLPLLYDLAIPADLEKCIGLDYDFSNRKPPAMAKFEYTIDGADLNAGENRRRYNELVDFQNNPITSLPLVGMEEHVFQFAPTKFRKDDIGIDTISFWTEQSYANLNFNLFFDFIIFYNLTLWITNADESQEDDDHFLLLQNGINYVPKIIVIDPTTRITNTLAPRLTIPGNTDRYYRNWECWFNDNFNFTNFDDKKPKNPNGTTYNGGGDNMYSRFWAEFVDPRLNANAAIKGVAGKAVMTYDCDQIYLILDTIKKKGFNLGIRVPVYQCDTDEYLIAQISSIEIKAENITVSFEF